MLPASLFSWARLSHAPAARAADLGGDCCADLEERVAELEATTVRKGNKKVSVTLYGKVNKAVLFWDDGAEKNIYAVDNNYEVLAVRPQGLGKNQGRLVGGLSDRGRKLVRVLQCGEPAR